MWILLFVSLSLTLFSLDVPAAQLCITLILSTFWLIWCINSTLAIIELQCFWWSAGLLNLQPFSAQTKTNVVQSQQIAYLYRCMIIDIYTNII